MSVAGVSFSLFQINRRKAHSENITSRKTTWCSFRSTEGFFVYLYLQVYKVNLVCMVFVNGRSRAGGHLSRLVTGRKKKNDEEPINQADILMLSSCTQLYKHLSVEKAQEDFHYSGKQIKVTRAQVFTQRCRSVRSLDDVR